MKQTVESKVMTTPIIRQATNADRETVQQIIYSILREYKLSVEPESTDADLKNIEKNYTEKGDYFGVVELDGKIVSTFAVSKRSENVCELRKMYLLPDYRGKGIGKLMVNFALEEARKKGFKKMELETASALKEAISLYQKVGFVKKSTDPLVPRCDLAFELEL